MNTKTSQAAGSALESCRLAYSVDEFCKATGIGRRTFYALQAKGEGPAVVKIGRRTLIRREAAERWLADLEATADPEGLFTAAAPQSTATTSPLLKAKAARLPKADATPTRPA